MTWANMLRNLILTQHQNLEMFVRLSSRNITRTPNNNLTEITKKTWIWRRRRRRKMKKSSEKTRKTLAEGLMMIVELKDGGQMSRKSENLPTSSPWSSP